MFKLIGSRCYLTTFEERHMDSEEYLGWLRDYEVMKTINRRDYLRPVSLFEVREYCTTVMRSPDDLFLALYIQEGDDFIGTLRVKMTWYTRVADIGIMIGDRHFWGRGIATEAIQILGAHLFDKLGTRKLTAGLMSVNPGMQRAFEKAGFRLEGVFRQQDYFEGQYTDHLYMGCLKDELVRTGAAPATEDREGQ